MATPGIPFELTEEIKRQAIVYVESTGLFKNRLSNFMGVSRPTLDRVLEQDDDFFTRLKIADSKFCQSLIESVKKKNPAFLLKTKYREEFDTSVRFINYDPEEQIRKMVEMMDSDSDENFVEPTTT
jgi:hypothetical protein